MIEDIFEGSFADTLKRVFVPCKRVISESGCCNSGIFSGNKVIRNFVASDYPGCTVEKGGHLLLDYGKELAGGIKIVTSRRGASKVRIRFGESVSECCGEPNRDHAFHDAELTLPAYATLDFGNTGFRFVRIEALTDIPVASVMAMYRHLDIEAVGFLECSDPLLQRIWDVNTLSVRKAQNGERISARKAVTVLTNPVRWPMTRTDTGRCAAATAASD